MDVYTLDDEGLGRDIVIDEFDSLVWTERHVDPGEIRLLLPATEYNYKLMTPGTLLATYNSQEVMLVDTREVEEGTITATGKTLELFLNERDNGAFTATDTPAGIMGQIVQNMIDRQVETWLPGIMVGYLEPGNGVEVTEEIEAGPCYANVLKIAQKYGYNFGLYRVSNEFGGYNLHFSVHLGEDRTSDQSNNKLVRFSPGLDSLANTKDLTSDVGFKSVVVAMPPTGMEFTIGGLPAIPSPIKVSKVPNSDTDYQPWRERVLEINCDDITLADLGPEDATDVERFTRLNEIMDARARKKLRKQQRTEIVDGEVTPSAQYKYKGDDPGGHYTTYGLGDRVEVGGHFGEIRKGLVTEHVRSYDRTGGRSYPAVSDKRAAVLTRGLAEKVLTWVSYSEGFWSNMDEDWENLAKPMFWEAGEGEMIVPGLTNLGTPREDMVKYRWRWGMNPGDSHYLEYPAPVPYRPPASSRVQAIVSWDELLGAEEIPSLTYKLESTAGGDFGFWMPDEEAWYLYAEHPGETEGRAWSGWMPQTMEETDPVTGEVTQVGWRTAGWMALTQLYPTDVAVDM